MKVYPSSLNNGVAITGLDESLTRVFPSVTWVLDVPFTRVSQEIEETFAIGRLDESSIDFKSATKIS